MAGDILLKLNELQVDGLSVTRHGGDQVLTVDGIHMDQVQIYLLNLYALRYKTLYPILNRLSSSHSQIYYDFQPVPKQALPSHRPLCASPEDDQSTDQLH